MLQEILDIMDYCSKDELIELRKEVHQRIICKEKREELAAALWPKAKKTSSQEVDDRLIAKFDVL